MGVNVKSMEPRISIITLGVTDLLKSTAFYSEGLGLPLIDSDSNANIAFFNLNSLRLALYPFDLLAVDAKVQNKRDKFDGITLAHNVKSKKRVDSLMRRAEVAGAKIVKPAADAFWGGYSGYFADIDNHLWEIAWNPHFWIE